MGRDQMGGLMIRVKRGIDLVVRDLYSSDPYVVISMGDQKYSTRVINSNCNPEWNEELTFSITDPFLPIKLTVYDHDTCSMDDEIGDAEIDIKPYLQCMEVDLLGDVPIGTVVKKVHPNRNNCLAEESKIVWMETKKIVQDMIIRLKNVEKGEVEIQIEWVDLPETRALSNRHLDSFN